MGEKRPIDSLVNGALDLLVYVPVGLAVSAKDLVPELARRGRERVTGQVASARVVGQFAVQQGQTQASRAFQRARDDAEARLAEEAAPPSPPPAAPARTATAHSGPGADALAIPGYDSLSASQVLPRLEALGTEELEAIRAYEGSHRGRKTILGRIAQLQA